MAQSDWERLLAFPPEELTEEEKDDLFDIVTWFNIESEFNVDRLKLLLRHAQEILKFKGEQVESLVFELDELAARQGREEAQRHQALMEELQELRTRLSHSEKVGKQISRGPDVDGLRQELTKCELQNEQLVAELKGKEREVVLVKKEIEKLSNQVAVLEREKAELRLEVAALQEEKREQLGIPEEEHSELSAEKQQELLNTIREKNKHISELLGDIETVEKENLLLREKLSTVRDELSEATKHLTQLLGEVAGLKHTCQEQEEKLSSVEEKNAALRNQVQELVHQKTLRDSQLDDFTEALDSRVQEWKRVLEKKDAEIEELQARLSHLAAQAPNIQIDTERSRVALLTQTLQKREDQIEGLQKQLTEATKELNDSATIIEQFKSQKSKHNLTAFVEATAVKKLRTQLKEAEERVTLLEGKLKDAEEDAQQKAEEATEMIVQLREYESGEYGLAEAVSEIKELRQQRKVRDKHIEELVQAANKLEAEASQMEEQNLALREKLGLPLDELVSVEGVLAQRRKEQSLMRVLQQQAERLEEEKVQLKLENRKFMQQVNALTQQLSTLSQQLNSPQNLSDSQLVKESSPVSTMLEVSPMEGEHTSVVPASLDVPEMESKDADLQSLKSVIVQPQVVSHLESQQEKLEKQTALLQEKLTDVTNENEALRKGMHEILDSIHNQDGISLVQLESQSLERLLEALDSRHVSGWYHPAMRLQAQIHSVEGSNAILREQLRATRLEGSRYREELQRAEMKIEQLVQNLSSLQEGQNIAKSVYEEMTLPPNMSLSSTEVIAKLNIHLLHVLNEHHKQEDINKSLERTLEELNKKFNVIRHQMGLLYKQYGVERSEWKKLEENLKNEQERLMDKVANLEVQLEEYKKHFEALSQGAEDQQKFLLASAQQLADLHASEVMVGRKCKALQNMENILRKENEKMKEEINAMECAVTRRIGDLQRQKEMSSYQITALQNKLEESVPVASLESVNRQLNELTARYRDMLQKQHISECERQLATRLEGEVEVLRRDKEHLNTELLNTKEKLYSLEVLVSSVSQDTVSQDTHDNQISMLAKKLANVELKEVYEKQRADHAVKMYQIVKGQLTQLEDRLSELEAHNDTLQKHNLELQVTERELRDDLMKCGSCDELEQMRNHIRELEAQKVELQLEKERLHEIGDIAQEQVRSLELWKLSQDYHLESLRQQILELQSSDEKASIARLSHEVLTARLNEAACRKKFQQLQNEMTKLQAYCLRQEYKVEEKERAMSQLRSQLNARCSALIQMIQKLRHQYSGALPLVSQEHVSLSLHRSAEECRVASMRLSEAHKLAHEAVTRKDELEHEVKALKELKVALEQSESQTQGQKQLVEWHNRNTELRLKELKSRRRAEFLETQCQQAEERLQRQDEHIAAMEEERIKVEKDWEQAQLAWEHTQAELHKQLSEYENQEKIANESKYRPNIVVQDTGNAVGDTNLKEQLKQTLGLVSSQSQSLLKYEGELAQLKTKVNSLVQQLQEKEGLVQLKDRIIAELRTHISSTKPLVAEHSGMQPDKETAETSDKLALKATVDSLQNILTQKEETIARYQQLLKEGRDEHSKVAGKLQEELQGLQAALSTQHQAYNRLKNRNRQQLSSETRNMPAIIEKYLKQLQEREDEVAELQTTVGNLSNQLQAARQEMERWRVLAEDRLNNMGELRQRLEEQHQNELQRYKDEAQRYRLDLETAQQDLNLLQEQLKQQMESSQKTPSAILQSRVAMLKAQLQEKEAQRELLSKTVVELQNEVKRMAEAAALTSVSHSDCNILDLSSVPTSQEEKGRIGADKQTKKIFGQGKSMAIELRSAKAEIQRLQALLQQRSHQQTRKDALQESKQLSRESQLQKKVKVLEEQLQDLKEKQEKEVDADAHKIKSAEEIARWGERKKWQQTVEKLRQKVKEKASELEKMQKANVGLRDIVSRLEREKNILDGKLKLGKGSVTSVENRIKSLERDKLQLEMEVSALKTKLEMQQHHAGGLGAAMLQERLEAQQRRIAALELSKKGNSAVATEMEKMQESQADLQKTNLQLESENLELRLELEKIRNDTPHLREKVELLEGYITLLKSEQAGKCDTGDSEDDPGTEKEQRSTVELRKTIIALKRVVEKLQSKNKLLEASKSDGHAEWKARAERLQTDVSTLRTEKQTLQQRCVSALKKKTELQTEIQTLKEEKRNLEEQYQKISEKVSVLETELELSKKLVTSLEKTQESLKSVSESGELQMLRSQVVHKSHLLVKVKALLQKAAVKERALYQQVETLRGMLPAEILETLGPYEPIDKWEDVEVL